MRRTYPVLRTTADRNIMGECINVRPVFVLGLISRAYYFGGDQRRHSFMFLPQRTRL